MQPIAAREIVILSGARTPIGSYGGALKAHSPCALAAIAAKEAIRRSGLSADCVEHAVFGNVIHTEPRDMYLSRVAMMDAGVPCSTPALTLNRLCGSGLEAVVTAARAISLGETDVALAGGAESMSRSPHTTRTMRWGLKHGDTEFDDMMIGALTDPFGGGHMGNTAENVAEAHQISRSEQDAFAAESHRRAAAAQSEGRFDEQIVPVEVRTGKNTELLSRDEGVRDDVKEEQLSKLRPFFKKDGTVTAGNASSLNDGAGALIIAAEGVARQNGVKPFARILGWSHAGVPPMHMGTGPIPAVAKLMKGLGLNVSDFDVIESNEAFAAQACAVSNALQLPPEKTNPNGGAIALGHPLGATGAMLLIKAIYELRRIGGGLGLVTMCIGGGQGIAMAVEAPDSA